ncbi:leucyl aminopeptidase family protein [Georgenia sp. Z1344]|uniref:leucyl aminopeptidase family protein n=1 Tax=Georgenia sp. Z1344 TaxID=3416706 RepID=UPI003CE9A149
MPSEPSDTPVVDLPPVGLPGLDVSDRPWSDALATDPVPDAVALLVGADGPGPRAGEVAERYGIDLEAELTDGTAGSVRTVRLPRMRDGVDVPWAGLPATVHLVRTGDAGVADLRAAGLGLGRALAGAASGVVVLESARAADPAGTADPIGPDDAATEQPAGDPAVPAAPADAVAALAAGLWLDAYRLPTRARTSSAKPPVGAVELLVPGWSEGTDVPAAARESVTATHHARALTATRSTVKNPAWTAAAAQHLVDGLEPEVRARVSVDVQDEARLAERGAGAILAVGAGSPTPPRLVTVTYTPASPVGRRVALVGKGITFDTGGLSKKPTDGMLTMSTDMAGSAVVLATVLAAARLGLPHTVTAVLPLAENAFGGGAYRPGDVVRTLSGRTVEIGNTDAEGRLVLADGLTHAIDVADPDTILDVATLTGAAKIALGTTVSALFATDDALAEELAAAGDAAGEKVWRLPMPDDSEAALDSDLADVRQTPRADVHAVGGTIFAAMFLRRFTQGRRWAHLDIAGTGRSTGGKRLATGAPTGVGAALLVHWLVGLGPDGREA